MKKVLTERPRRGGMYTYNDLRARENRGEYDDLPNHQGMRKPYRKAGEWKEFSDLIGPLKGYLHSCVGRRWDDVWSEICQITPSGNTIDEHLRSHVHMEVETKTRLIDGKLYCHGRYSGIHQVDGLYVDPDGWLCATAERPRYEKWTYRVVDGLTYREGDDGLLYPERLYRQSKARFPLKLIGSDKAMLIDGIWYWIEMADTPPARLVEYLQEGMVRRRWVYSARLDLVTGEFVQEGRYHADKRQMTSRDLRRHGLRNCR